MQGVHGEWPKEGGTRGAREASTMTGILCAEALIVTGTSQYPTRRHARACTGPSARHRRLPIPSGASKDAALE